MDNRGILPLIDLVFLTLGAILAAMTDMQVVHALPIDVATVGQGAAIVRQGQFAILVVEADRLTIDGQAVTMEDLASNLSVERVIVRADRKLETQRLLRVVAELARVGVEMSIEVREEPPSSSSK